MEKDWSSLISAFDPAEQARISRFAREEDRLRKAASHMLVSVRLGERLGVGYRELIFRRGGYGKPYLYRDRAPRFNISTSGALVVCAIARTEVGIDVELVAPLEASTIGLLLGHSQAASQAGSSEKELDAFYERWTMLESWLKAEGTGLHDGHPLAEFAPKSVDSKRFYMEARQPGMTPWILTSLNFAPPVPERYALAICRRPEEDWTEEVALLDGIELAKRFRTLL
ncbi:4'-phosphopantetheinyl transferase family protein [Saccharibacillus sacchari]|uniref:4'-phosphopantetheinyl transferase family protein n=1 Tax=Saccharibacillus sacchari TaxID=456493 RepID=UPI0030EE05D9